MFVATPFSPSLFSQGGPKSPKNKTWSASFSLFRPKPRKVVPKAVSYLSGRSWREGEKERERERGHRRGRKVKIFFPTCCHIKSWNPEGVILSLIQNK